MVFENYFNLFICSFWLIKFSLHGGLSSNKVDVIFFQSSLIFNHRCMKIGFLVKFNFPTAISSHARLSRQANNHLTPYFSDSTDLTGATPIVTLITRHENSYFRRLDVNY